MSVLMEKYNSYREQKKMNEKYQEQQGLTRFPGGALSFDCTTVYIYITYGYNISSDISSLLILYKVVTRKEERIFESSLIKPGCS